MKVTGWCLRHDKLVDSAKFRGYCSKAYRGKRCRQFTYKVPNHVKEFRGKVEGRGEL